MFLRRLIKSEATVGGGTKTEGKPTNQGPPPGMQTMGASLQSKFARGVNYNMKIIIKGDRNVGKTCLHLRLQGKKFREEYLPTDEIQVASIQWSYKTSDDIIKVEIWDVVDKGRKKKKLEGLKLNTVLPQLPEETCLDAEFIDVYKGTHGIIMLFDVTKHWTFDYVERELAKIPSSIPILILSNHRDMGHHRTVTEEQARTLVEEAQRSREGPIKCAESSMRNGYGLKYVHKFFSLPFLHLQKMTLMVQLEKNAEDTEASMQELDLLENTEDQNYDIFSDSVNAKRREQQEKLAQKAIEDARVQEQQQAPTNQMSKSNGGGANSCSMTKSFSFSTSLPPIKEAPTALSTPEDCNHHSLKKQLQQLPLSSFTQDDLKRSTGGQLVMPSKSAPLTPCEGQLEVEATTAGSFLGKFLNSSRKNKKQANENKEPTSPIQVNVPVGANLPPVRNVDEFRPEADGLDEDFLSDVCHENKQIDKTSSPNVNKMSPNHLDSDEEFTAEAANPLVAGFQDNLDSSDEETAKSSVRNPEKRRVAGVRDPVDPVDLSSDDDGAGRVVANGNGSGTKLMDSQGCHTKEDHRSFVFLEQQRDERPEPVNQVHQDPPTLHTLNAADFDVLEEKYIKKGSKEISSGADGFSTSTDDDVARKKKRHKDRDARDKEGEKEKQRRSKHKVKDEVGEEGKQKKKNKKKHKKPDDDLEKFLGSTYESL